MTRQTSRYVVLDGLRGVAALAVVCWHARAVGLVALPSAYLAVDLFFWLSGWVIAAAYEERLRQGLSFLGFWRIRMIRLYPLYITGTIAFAAYAIAAHFAPAGTVLSYRDIGLAFLRALIYLPAPSPDPEGFLFPLNGPAWSLFFELVVNALYAFALPWLSNRVIGAIMALSAALLAFAAWHFGHLNLGWDWTTLLTGFPRASLSFFGGVLLFRLRDRLRLPAIPPVISLALVLALLAVPFHSGLWLMPLVGLAMPALILTSAAANPTGRQAAVMGWLGAVSYPIYALHAAMLAWLNGAWRLLHLTGWWMAPVSLALMVLGAHLGLKLWDEPVRAWLSRATRQTPARAAA